MSIRFRSVAIALIVLAGVTYIFWPVYGFIAEDHPSLRNPLAWHNVPATSNCHSSFQSETIEILSDRACSMLLAHLARLHTPSLSVAVARDGELLWSSAVGWADIERKIPANRQTLYRIGSTSKTVTGTILARLVQDGTVSLDEPIGTYMKDLPNPLWPSLTLRQLASHMAGLPEYETNRDLVGTYHSMALRRHHSDVRQGLDLFDGSPQRFVPGSDFEYSSFGSLLMASVLQEATGVAFADLVQQQLLVPLGLATPLMDEVHPDRARFYQLDGERVQPWRKVDLSNKLPGGGFMSRPEDLVKMGSAWLDPKFITASIREQFWTPQKMSNGEINPQSYGLNWRWDEVGQYAHHGGVSKGSMAWIAVYPAGLDRAHSLVIAMTINTTLVPFSDFASLQGELIELFSQ
jgi:serine beta-lactamase-like protein LACTB